MAWTLDQLRAIAQRANCCLADLAFDSSVSLSYGNQKKGFCEFEKAEALFHYINALRCYKPVDTVIGEYTTEACSDSNSVIDAFGEPVSIDIDANLSYTIDSLVINNVDITGTLIDTTDTDLIPLFTDITVALANATGENWTFTQVSDFEFTLCAPCSLEGTVVEIFISVTDTDLLQTIGTIDMTFELECTIDPANTILQTEEMNCVNVDDLIEKIESLCNFCCSCNDFDYNLTKDTVPTAILSNIELQDDGGFELLD